MTSPFSTMQLLDRRLQVGGDLAVDERVLDEVGHHAGAEAAHVLGHALPEHGEVPAHDAGEAAPTEQLVVRDSVRHVRRQERLFPPVAEVVPLDELDLEVAAGGQRARRVRIVIIGKLLDELPFDARLVAEPLDRFDAGVDEHALQLGIFVAGAEELQILEAALARVGDAGGRLQVIVGQEDLTARVGADAAQLARLLEDDDLLAGVVRDDGRAEAAQARADRNHVHFQVPFAAIEHREPLRE